MITRTMPDTVLRGVAWTGDEEDDHHNKSERAEKKERKGVQLLQRVEWRGQDESIECSDEIYHP